MNSEENQEELTEAQNLPENGPGHLLAKKREALGMSVQDVADALHITMHYVRALETDAHDKLPGDVFIKGYLRSYASLLKLDPSVIVNVYIDYSSERANAELVSHTRKGRGSKRSIPWIVVSGIAFVAMAIALWYFGPGTSATPVRSTGAAAAAPAPASVATRTISSGTVATLDEIGTTAAVPATLEQIAPPEPSFVFEEALVAENARVPDSIEVTAEDALVQSVPMAAALPERLFSVDGGGEDLVQITFTGESMVQVDDANDEQLYRDVQIAGDVLRISGTAPFNILLGDASNSALSFNGDAVDFSASIRIDKSARLTIGL